MAWPAAIRRFLTPATLAILASGCAMSPGATTSPTVAPSPIRSDEPSPSQTEAASTAPQLRYVAIGDSIAAATRCECARFPDLYGQLSGQALGQRQPVWVQNLAVNGATSSDLVGAVSASQSVQHDAIRDADIITITIGINDINPCGAESDRACYESGIAGLQTNLEAVLDQIDTLQADHPHILRATAYYNFNIGKPGVAQFGPTFQAFYADQLAALKATICEAVAAHDGLCVELLTAFNGPAGDQDAGELLVFDHEHPSREGHKVIAEAIAASGYAPLLP